MAVPARLHVGLRGRVLLFFGSLDIVYALSLAFPTGESRRTGLFMWLSSIAPLWLWASAWFGVGVICLWQGFCRQDRTGYTAATCLKVFWGLACLGGWLFGDVDRGYVSVAIWLGLAYLMGRVLARWPEPGDRRGPTWTRQSSSPSSP